MKNRLDEFQSHSIHYVVLAARSTEDLQRFSEVGDRAQAQSLAAVDACRQLGDEVRLAGTAPASVFLMLDTRRFSQFTISNLTLDTRIAGFSVPGSNTPNAVGVELTFDVLDSVGISFANFLQFLMDQRLRVSFDGMVLLVRVLFIGHTDSGGSKVIQSIGVPAMFSEVQLDLNDVKGLYTCRCRPLIGMVSNAQYNAKWTNIGTASSYFTGAGANTLGAVVRAFEESLNRKSLRHFTQFNAQTQTPGAPLQSQTRYGRPVQYMITLPAGWGAFTFSGPTQGSAKEINFAQLIKDEEAKRGGRSLSAAEQQRKAQTNATAPANDSFVAVDPNLTITEVLDRIFEQTVEVQRLGNFTRTQTRTNEVRFYKHLISVTSDDQSFTVHVDVVEFIVPNVDAATQAATTTEGDQLIYETVPAQGGRPAIKRPRNYLEFDYIFSSRNLDVLSLDLKIENLNILLMQGSKLGQGELFNAAVEGQRQEDGDGVVTDPRTAQGMRQKDPALMPMRTALERTNFTNLAANVVTDGDTPQAVSQQYTRNLSDFYNAGPVKAKLEIRGNPDYLERITLGALPQHVSAVTVAADGTASTVNEGVKTQYREAFERNLLRLTPGLRATAGGGFRVDAPLQGPSFVSTPIFVKVNVYGPNTDFITNEPIAGQNFAKQLFYDNFYWVGTVKSKIEGARFTQELELHSFSVYGHASTSARGPSEPPTQRVTR